MARLVPLLLLVAGLRAHSSTQGVVFRSIAEIRRMKPDAVHSPASVHVRAVVTYYDSVAPNLFVQDSTGGIWVDLRGVRRDPPRPGQLLELRGDVGSGFAPYIANPKWTVIGSAPFPKPVHLHYEQAANGLFDSQWVEMDGVVRSFVQELEGQVLVIDVATPTGAFKVRVPDYRAAFPLQLVDARVRFKGVCGSSFNRRNQLVAIHLFTPSIDLAEIVDAPPAEPFAVPATPVNKVQRFSADFTDIHRIRVVGTVTAIFPQRGVFLMDSTGGLYVESQDGTPVLAGDEVEVIGFPSRGTYTPVLKSASFRRTGAHRALTPIPVDGRAALHGEYDARLVTIAATVQLGTPTSSLLSLESLDHIPFEAMFTTDLAHGRLPSPGTTIRVTGICSIKTDDNGNPSAFQIVLRTPTDIQVISGPPWLTARTARLALLFSGLGSLVVLTWVVVLRARVHKQTELIHDRLRTEAALEEKYRNLFRGTLSALYLATPGGTIEDCNDACARLFGYTGRGDMLANRSEAEQVARQFQDCFSELTSGRKQQVSNAEYHLLRPDGTEAWVLVNVRYSDESSNTGPLFEVALTDITERKIAEEQVRFLAFYDPLTGLANRSLVRDRLAKAVAVARRNREKVAVLFVDLDRFKIINDSLGHSVGDHILREIGQRLSNAAREQDTVARVGGDEFLVVITGVKDLADVSLATERMVSKLGSDIDVQGRSFRINCSIGISLFPDHGTDVETLIRNADTAMYCVKESGRHGYQFFTNEMNSEVVEKLTLENSLRNAIANNELFLLYQPQIKVSSGGVAGVEALLRWHNHKLGLIPPSKFIRIAENTGLIIPIGEWVLQTACEQAKSLCRHTGRGVPIAINVSAVQFRDEGFCSRVESILCDSGVDPGLIEFELTESLLLTNSDVLFRVLQRLKELGLKLSIDDFGTGYSSLSYLRHFPVSKLKIDRSFVRHVATNSDDAIIAAAIIGLARNLHLEVIAEGVENEDQLRFFTDKGCDQIQGFYFSPPISAEELLQNLGGAGSFRRQAESTLVTLGGSAGRLRVPVP